MACIESGYFVRELADAAYALETAIASGEKVVIGVNRFRTEHEPLDVFEVDPDSERRQIESVQALRDTRDGQRVAEALVALEHAAKRGENILPATIEAVKAYATVGEIVGKLREVHGSWQPTSVV